MRVGLFFSLGHSTVVFASLRGNRGRPSAPCNGAFDAFKDDWRRDRHRGLRGLPPHHRASPICIVLISGVAENAPIAHQGRRCREIGLQLANGGLVTRLFGSRCSAHHAKLADVSARLPVRPRLRHRDRDRFARHRRVAELRKDCRCGRSCYFPRSSPQAWPDRYRRRHSDDRTLMDGRWSSRSAGSVIISP